MLSVAIIGTGNISPNHIQAYLAFPDRCRIVALVDIYPEKAHAKNREYGLNAQVCSSHKELLGREDIDLVSICTPPYCHGEIAVDFLLNGKHVLLEKPMAPSLEECDRIIEAARQSGKILSVVAQNRFRDPINNLKQVLDSGKIGKVTHAQVESYWWRGHSYYDLWWRGLWEKEGGGCTLNHAVHHIDMLGWMMGRPQKVVAMLSNAAHDNAEVEDISVAVMQYGQGALAQVTSSVIHHGEEQQVVFQGERARISAPWRVFANTALPNGFPAQERDTALEQELEDFYQSLPHLEHIAHEGQVDDMLTAVETGCAPFITGESGRLTIELITAIYKAGIEQRAVELPIGREDAYYRTEGILKNAPRFFEKTTSLENAPDSGITVGSDYR